MLRSKTIKEGSVGLFILFGLIAFGSVVFWLRGGTIRNKAYTIVAEFQDAGGLREGAKVRYRGIEVGKISGIIPSSNGVEIVMTISNQLKIPKDVKIKTNHFGLLGEAVIDITPSTQLATKAESINPLSENCLKSKLILCDKERIKGEVGVELVNSLTRLTEIYSNEEFYSNLNKAAINAALAAEKIALLTDDVSAFSKDIQKDVNKITKTIDAVNNTANKLSVSADAVTNTADKISNSVDAVTNTADTATYQINQLGNQFAQTSRKMNETAIQINFLVANINGVIDYNKANFSQAIVNVSDTSKKLTNLVEKLDSTVTEVNSTLKETDTKKIVKNLENFSQNLQEISTTLNKPSNFVTLQQTLDSARVTFENTAKITSDLDELTGDPEFRKNVRKLVDGLSNLMSYNETLEKQVELAKSLESANRIVANKSKSKNQPISSPTLKKLDKNTIAKSKSLKSKDREHQK